uniref:Endoglucanase n=1 Tax=Kalanchoe fedtschenkoi TaxID=63787 RepID=A0A7N0ZRV5_KALFE
MSLALLEAASGQYGFDYGEALSKSILFFEGQRSGKLPPTQRMKWRGDSALHDGFESHVDLVGGYYEAGSNVKHTFPMAFTTTMLAWSTLEYQDGMGPEDRLRALEAIKWGTDYLLKATDTPGVIYVQVGETSRERECWERPEDMDTPRTVYAVNKTHPGSEVAGEISAALAASSTLFRAVNPSYSDKLLRRAISVFKFGKRHKGSYRDSVGAGACSPYCGSSGYMDELIWGAAWLYRATNKSSYLKYVKTNLHLIGNPTSKSWNIRKETSSTDAVAEFGWDCKHGGIHILLSQFFMPKQQNETNVFVANADRVVCSIVPASPTPKSVRYSLRGLLYKSGRDPNMQHVTACSFLLITYSRYLNKSSRNVYCRQGVKQIFATPFGLQYDAQSQVNYILGANMFNMSYMVGYGKKYPTRIRHRSSSLPSVTAHPKHIKCREGYKYFHAEDPNPNLLVGAVVGGPNIDDSYADTREVYSQSEPATYINAPLVGLLAYFKAHPY